MDTITKTNIIIASISALATLSAAVIYYYTLNELKKQRENTYKPHLFIDDINFHVQSFKKGDIMFPSKWTSNFENANTFQDFEQESYRLSDFALKCYNIGFGTAKSIAINFSYDLDFFIDEINKLNQLVSKEMIIKIEKQGIFLSFDCANEEIPFPKKAVAIKNAMTNYVSYILPVNVTKDNVALPVPIHYLELLNVYAFLFSSTFNKNVKKFEIIIPAITIDMNYLDISNKKYFKKMIINTEIYAWSTAGYSGVFKIKEE